MKRLERCRQLVILGLVVCLIAAAAAVGSATVAAAGPTDDRSESAAGFTAEVTEETLFGGIRTVTIAAQHLDTDRVVITVGDQTKTVVRPRDGRVETTLVVGSYFRGPDAPLVVTAVTDEGQRYAGTSGSESDTVELSRTPTDPGTTFESARATVAHEGLFGIAQAVTFEYHAPPGTIVEFEAGWMHSQVVSDGEPDRHTIFTGWGFAPYPLDVRASIEDGQTVASTLTYFDNSVSLVDEGSNETTAPQYAVDLAGVNGTVGETVTVAGTVTNDGTAAGTQSVTLAVGNSSTTESLSLAPGQSTTIALNLTPTAGDAGTYTATLESANESATATVRIEEQASGPTLQSATALVESGSLSIGDSVAFDLGGCSEDSTQCNLVQTSIDEDGTLTVAEDGFQFAPLQTYASSLQGNVSVVTTAPNGLEGSVDMERGTVQLEGTLDAEIPEFTELLEQQRPAYNETCGFQIDLSATTGDSGNLSGTPLSIEGDGGVATATLVDGTYEVGTISEDRCGSLASAIDSELGLPSNSGANELALGLELQLSEDARPNPEVTDLSVTDTVTKGDTATVEATVENTGGAGQTQIRAVVDEAAAFDSVVDSKLLTLDAGETKTVELAWDTNKPLTVFDFSAGGNVPLGPGDYTVRAESGDSARSAGVTVEADDGDDGGDGSGPPISGFTAFGQQGNITLGGNTEDPIVLPRCDGTTPLDSPDDQVTWEDECFEIDVDSLEFSESGTVANFSVGAEDVTFPQIQTRDVNADYANVSLSAPDGFAGSVNIATGEVTITGQFEIFVEVRGSLLGDADCKTETTLEMTTGTGQQGLVEGEPLSLNGATGNTTVVSDSFTVPGFETVSGSGTVCSTAEGQYGLPAETPGDNTFQFALLIQLEQ